MFAKPLLTSTKSTKIPLSIFKDEAIITSKECEISYSESRDLHHKTGADIIYRNSFVYLTSFAITYKAFA